MPTVALDEPVRLYVRLLPPDELNVPARPTLAPPIDTEELPRTNRPPLTRPAAKSHLAETPPASDLAVPNLPLTRQSPGLALTAVPVALAIWAPLPNTSVPLTLRLPSVGTARVPERFAWL